MNGRKLRRISRHRRHGPGRQSRKRSIVLLLRHIWQRALRRRRRRRRRAPMNLLRRSGIPALRRLRVDWDLRDDCGVFALAGIVLRMWLRWHRIASWREETTIGSLNPSWWRGTVVVYLAWWTGHTLRPRLGARREEIRRCLSHSGVNWLALWNNTNCHARELTKILDGIPMSERVFHPSLEFGPNAHRLPLLNQQHPVLGTPPILHACSAEHPQ